MYLSEKKISYNMIKLLIASVILYRIGKDKDLYRKIFEGDNKFTIGMILIFSQIAGFFMNMRKLKVNDYESVSILLMMIYVGRLII